MYEFDCGTRVGAFRNKCLVRVIFTAIATEMRSMFDASLIDVFMRALDAKNHAMMEVSKDNYDLFAICYQYDLCLNISGGFDTMVIGNGRFPIHILYERNHFVLLTSKLDAAARALKEVDMQCMLWYMSLDGAVRAMYEYDEASDRRLAEHLQRQFDKEFQGCNRPVALLA